MGNSNDEFFGMETIDEHLSSSEDHSKASTSKENKMDKIYKSKSMIFPFTRERAFTNPARKVEEEEVVKKVEEDLAYLSTIRKKDGTIY